MIVYQSTKGDFKKDVLSGNISDIIIDNYKVKLNEGVAPSEKRSWQSSLFYMNTVLQDPNIPDSSGVSIEMQIPRTNKRIDFIITGQDANYKEHVVIIELKGWEKAEKTNMPGMVRTRFNGHLVTTQHPSYQASSYAALLNFFNEAVYMEGIRLSPCAFLHNYKPNGVLDDPFYEDEVQQAPIFMRNDIEKLRSFIKKFVKYGDTSKIIYKIENGKIRPSKKLTDNLKSMLEGNDEFIMIDEQKKAFEYVMNAVIYSPDKKKKVLIIEGGPGTGKSVVAINLLVKLLAKEKLVSYVTKNAAPRTVYSSLLSGDMRKTYIDNLFQSSGTFSNVKKNTFDALIVDEAHRLNEKSGFYGNLGDNQIKELIDAASVSVFFIDEDQRVHIKDIGEKDEIRKWAKMANAEIIETELTSQFRCNGSDGYLAWIDHMLQIRKTANTKLEGIDFDFQVFNSPNKVFEIIKEKNKINNKSRLVAGYCWDWVSRKDKSEMDIKIPEHGFAKRWNLKDDGNLWLIKEDSINEIGCIHTCQGLELDYVGVIIGPDLKVRDGEVITDFYQRSNNDHSIRGFKKMMKESPEEAKSRTEAIIKNTYRTLMTRGMKGCYIYCTDKETSEYFKEKIGDSL